MFDPPSTTLEQGRLRSRLATRCLAKVAPSKRYGPVSNEGNQLWFPCGKQQGKTLNGNHKHRYYGCFVKGRLRSIHKLKIWISEGFDSRLKHMLDVEGWRS